MSINSNHIDDIIQFAILVAGECDHSFLSRLGPIHIIKYIYLADLAHAKRCNGDTYTGISWKFFNFGPWNHEAFSRIQPTVKKMDANIYKFASEFADDDVVRFEKRDPVLLQDLERRIPAWITRNVKQDVKKYLSDTASLLNHVYLTEPMLSAAPNELLDFSVDFLRNDVSEKVQLIEDSFSKSKQMKIDKKIDALRAQITNGTLKRKKIINPVPFPIYDEVYQDGLKLLDTLDSPLFEEKKIVVSFDDSVWNSDTRKGIYGK